MSLIDTQLVKEFRLKPSELARLQRLCIGKLMLDPEPVEQGFLTSRQLGKIWGCSWKKAQRYIFRNSDKFEKKKFRIKVTATRSCKTPHYRLR